jgi:hypothetical protein
MGCPSGSLPGMVTAASFLVSLEELKLANQDPQRAGCGRRQGQRSAPGGILGRVAEHEGQGGPVAELFPTELILRVGHARVTPGKAHQHNCGALLPNAGWAAYGNGDPVVGLQIRQVVFHPPVRCKLHIVRQHGP